MKLRANKKLTQEQVAELIQRDLRTVQKHEKGENQPSGPVLKRYAALYGVHWLEIKTGHAPPNGIVSEIPPLYGRTSEVVVDGKPVKVTEFAPEGEAGRIDPSPDELLRQAFASNLEKDREILQLRVELNDARNKLLVVRHIFLKYSRPGVEPGAFIAELSGVLGLEQSTDGRERPAGRPKRR